MFENKTILITGGATRLGKGLALLFAKNNAKTIIIHYNTNIDSAYELQIDLQELGCHSIIIQCDFSKPETIQKMFNDLYTKVSQIDILINNAAIFEKSRLDNSSVASLNRIMNVNIISPIMCIQYASKVMTNSLVVNISDSTVNTLPVNFAGHAIAKSTLLTMTDLAVKTYSPNIRINTIIAGLIMKSDFDTQWDALIKKTPLKKSGSVEDIFNTIQYLSNTSYVTGATINVDGGISI